MKQEICSKCGQPIPIYKAKVGDRVLVFDGSWVVSFIDGLPRQSSGIEQQKRGAQTVIAIDIKLPEAKYDGTLTLDSNPQFLKANEYPPYNDCIVQADDGTISFVRNHPSWLKKA